MYKITNNSETGLGKSRAWVDASIAGPLLMLTASFIFSLMSYLVKQMPSSYNVWHIGFIRFAGGVLVLLTFFRYKLNIFKGWNIPLLITRGCTGSIAFISAVTAIRMLPLSTFIVIFYSYPVFAAIFSAMLYKETISTKKIICILTMMSGVGVLFDFAVSGQIFGQCMAIIAGAFAGLTVTLIRSLREHNGPVVIYLYFCTMGSLVTLPAFIISPIVPATPLEWIMIAGIVMTALVAQLLMNQGFFYCKGWEGGVYMSSETVFTSMIGIVLMHDPVSWRFWLGAFLILGSGFVLNRINASES